MITCNNKDPKFKNLTVGKQYEGTIDGDFVEITNDANVKARYNKKYFAVTETERPRRARPVPPPPVINYINLERFIEDHVSLEFDDHYNNEGELEVVIYVGGHRIASGCIQSTVASCGVGFFQGLNSLMNAIDALPEQFTDNGEIYNIQDVNRERLFAEIIERIGQNTPQPLAFLVLSTNSPDRDYLQNLNEHIRITSPVDRINPNSGNMIGLWVLDCTE